MHKLRKDGKVEVALHSTQTAQEVFWSDRFNSYVLVESKNGAWLCQHEACDLFSVNGNGEIRWGCRETWEGDAEETAQAVKHFGLIRR